MIDAGVAELIQRFPLGFVATVTPQGAPAVAPKGTFLVLSDTQIAFGNIRSPGTMTNLAANPACEVNFIDILKRKGARLRGLALTHTRGTADFKSLWPRWQAEWGDLATRISALVVIDVSAVKTFSTPPYDDGATEEEMIAMYKTKLASMYP